MTISPWSGVGSGEFDWYRWEDLRFPSHGINPPGVLADPGVDSDTGLLVFSGTQDNIIVGAAQMPHGWRIGSPVRPHVHVRFPTSANANTRWKFEYDIASVAGNFTNNNGVYTTLGTITIANPQDIKKHVLGSFGDLTMTGFKESAAVLWKISRLANSDAADTDTNDCVLVEFDIHFQVQKTGTVDET